MNRRAIALRHLIELVNHANAAVRENERAALERPLARRRVFVHRGRQTHRGGALARRVHRPRSGLLDVLEELRLGRPGVAEQEHVNVPAHAVLAVDVLFAPAEERHGDGHLDVRRAEDGRRNRRRDAVANVRKLQGAGGGEGGRSGAEASRVRENGAAAGEHAFAPQRAPKSATKTKHPPWRACESCRGPAP